MLTCLCRGSLQRVVAGWARLGWGGSEEGGSVEVAAPLW